MVCSMAIYCSSSTLCANGSLKPDNLIKFNNSSFQSYFSKNEQVVLRSKMGELNLDNNEIILRGEVEGRFNLNGEVFNIKTDSLSGDLLGKSILSKEKVIFKAEGFEIVASTMEINRKAQEGTKIIFWNANLNQIASDSRIFKGNANRIKLFLSKDLIVMDGNAVFYEDNMKIISDELHYDLNKDRILKSVNAQIINNL